MDEETKTDVAVDAKPGVVHQFARFAVGGFAAYLAETAATQAYDKALALVRARRAR